MKEAQLFLVIADMIKAVALSSWVFAAFALPLPLAAVAGSYSAGFALMLIVSRRSHRMIVAVSAHVVFGFALYFTLFGSVFRSSGAAYATLAILYSMLHAILWLRGIWLARQQTDHAFCATRLDEGLTIFLAGSLLSSLGGFPSGRGADFLAPFLAFSGLALLESRREHETRGGFSPSGKAGKMLSGLAGFALAILGLVRLVPALSAPAKASARALGRSAEYLLETLARFLSWLFKGKPKGAIGSGEAGDTIAQAERMPEIVQPLSSIVVWVLIGIAGFVVLLVLANLAPRLLAWLMKRSSTQSDASKDSLLLRLRKLAAAVLNQARRAFVVVAKIIAHFFDRLLGRRNPGSRERGPALRAYAALVAAGRRACLPRAKPETPREYAARLEREFPESARGSLSIAIEMEREVYGGVQTTDRLITPRIRATRLYAERIKKLCRPTSRRIASDTAPHNVHQGA